MKLLHYSETHRWSYIRNAWIFKDNWNDAEEIAMLHKKVEELQNDLEARTQQLEFVKNLKTKPLSDEEIWSLSDMVLNNSDVIGFARAIEAKVRGEK